jgi:hypothetical protein
MIDPRMLAQPQPKDEASRFAGLLLDFTVPAMAALLTIGLFLLALR